MQAVRADGSTFDVVDFDHRLSHRDAIALAERLRTLVSEIDGRDRPSLRVADATSGPVATGVPGARRLRVDEPRGWDDEGERAVEDDARARRR